MVAEKHNHQRKITLLKAKALNLIMYVCNFLYVSADVVKSVERIMYDFIWNHKHHVKKTTLIQSIPAGGLKMPDFTTLVKANKLNFIKRMINVNSNSNKTASVILKADNVERFLMYKNKTKYLHSLPNFYEQVLDIWYSSHNDEPNIPGDILNETIWYNERILIGNKPVFNKQWFNAGIRYIKDIFSDNCFLTHQQFASKYNFQCETLFYNGIKTAIPRTYLKIITCRLR